MESFIYHTSVAPLIIKIEKIFKIVDFHILNIYTWKNIGRYEGM